jgi:hypothetical protein
MNIIDRDNRQMSHELAIRREIAASAYTKAEADIAAFIAENEAAVSDTFTRNTLINNLNSLAFLENLKNSPTASFEERSTARKITQIRWLIILTLIILDLTPLLIVLLYKNGIYESIKEKEHENRVAILDIEAEQQLQERMIEIQQELKEKELKTQAMHRSIKLKIDSQMTFNEYRNFYQDTKNFNDLQCKGRDDIMHTIHYLSEKKLIDPKEREVADTEDYAKDTFEKTQDMAANMFWSNQSSIHLGFINKAAVDRGTDTSVIKFPSSS